MKLQPPINPQIQVRILIQLLDKLHQHLGLQRKRKMWWSTELLVKKEHESRISKLHLDMQGKSLEKEWCLLG